MFPYQMQVVSGIPNPAFLFSICCIRCLEIKLVMHQVEGIRLKLDCLPELAVKPLHAAHFDTCQWYPYANALETM